MSLVEGDPTQSIDPRFTVTSSHRTLELDVGSLQDYFDFKGFDHESKPVNIIVESGRGHEPTFARSALGFLGGVPPDNPQLGTCEETDVSVEVKLVAYSTTQATKVLKHELSHAYDFLHPEGLSDYDEERRMRLWRAGGYLATVGAGSSLITAQFHPLLGATVVGGNLLQAFRIGYLSHSHEVAARKAEKTKEIENLFVNSTVVD